MKSTLKLLLFILLPCFSNSQGYNQTWLLGYQGEGRINFSFNSDTLITEIRKMKFDDTEANISDSLGNFLFSSNGVWIANSNNDTMVNGTGLKNNYLVDPSGARFRESYCQGNACMDNSISTTIY